MANKKRNIKFGFLFWIAFILVVGLLFFINRNNIKQVLASVGHSKGTDDPQEQIQKEIERINEETTQTTVSDNSLVIEENARKQKNEPSPPLENPVNTQKEPLAESSDKHSDKKAETEKTSAKKTDTKQNAAEKHDKAATKQAEKTKPSEKTETSKTRQATIYFVAVGADGSISRVMSQRNLPVSDSPMADALKALFSGTTRAENEKGYRSLIPPDTKLLSAKVTDGVAYINVTESFEFNRYGIDGYFAELAQVVFTATEFPTVQSVQFLVEGRKKNYLGSDGVWIGSPLSRDSF